MRSKFINFLEKTFYNQIFPCNLFLKVLKIELILGLFFVEGSEANELVLRTHLPRN